MRNLIARFGDAIDSVISGFDRIVFKGFLKPLMFPEGAMHFLWGKKVLNKHFRDWVQEQTAGMVNAVDTRCRRETGRGIVHLPSSRTRKEELAHRQQDETGIMEGIIGAWSCVEAGQSYRAVFGGDKGHPQLRWEHVRCKHIYLYEDHPELGFLSLRLQTWFPYQVQFALNGREYLRRQLDATGIGYVRRRNKFLHLDDPSSAQRLFDRQLKARWPRILDKLVKDVFPTFRQTLGPKLHYYWTAWQTEWATDFIFRDYHEAEKQAAGLVAHALATGTANRVMRYLDRPLKKDGQPRADCSDEVQTRADGFVDGVRIRHWVSGNSVKVYNERNVLRVETTITEPSKFKVIRAKGLRGGGGDGSGPKERLPMRKGVADMPQRADVAQGVNNRMADQLAACTDSTKVTSLFDPVTKRHVVKGRKVRALEPLGKDRDLLMALLDNRSDLAGLANGDLCNGLGNTAWGRGRTRRQLAARVSRHIRLLRDHGILGKIPGQRRYRLTKAGRRITTALAALLSASTEELMREAA